MNIWTPLRRILVRHLPYHLLIPLVVGVGAEVLVAARGSLRAIPRAFVILLDLQHLVPLAAVIAAYVVVMLVLITKETTTPFETANFTTVEQVLKNATGYFALCALPMRDWFDPGAFKYFALLLATKQARPESFGYARVMIFPKASQRRDAEATMVDRYHAEALAAAHHRHSIPMGWLGPRKLREIVRGLTPEERGRIRRVHPLFRWLPASVVSRFPWPVELDFAVVERPGGRAVIIVPFKKAEAIVLTGAAAGPYERLADIVRAEVFEDDQRTVRLDHDFPRLLGAR